MSDNRKYYYLKLKENFYNSETMVILESMQDGLLYSNLLLKMYLMSLKSGGILMLNDHLPHTPQTIATFTRHQVGTVERALKVFLEFGLVEILTDGAYYMADIQLLIGQSSTEGERKKKERMRLKRQKLLPSGGADICPPYSQGDICPPEIRDKRLDIRDKSIENRESESARAYGRYQNVFLTDENWQTCRPVFPLYGASTSKSCPNTWPLPVSGIRAMPPPSGAGPMRTRKRRPRPPATVITA